MGHITRDFADCFSNSLHTFVQTIDRSIKLCPIAYWPILMQQRSYTKVRHACAYAWRAQQSCAERHRRAPRVLAHTYVVGGAYWIGLFSVEWQREAVYWTIGKFRLVKLSYNSLPIFDILLFEYWQRKNLTERNKKNTIELFLTCGLFLDSGLIK